VIAIFFIPMFYWLLSTASQRLFGAAKPAAAPKQDGGA
jgi:multidrug efflux pump